MAFIFNLLLAKSRSTLLFSLIIASLVICFRTGKGKMIKGGFIKLKAQELLKEYTGIYPRRLSKNSAKVSFRA